MTKHSRPRKVVTDEMRNDILSSKLTPKDLAVKHGIAGNTIYSILRNRKVIK